MKAGTMNIAVFLAAIVSSGCVAFYPVKQPPPAGRYVRVSFATPTSIDFMTGKEKVDTMRLTSVRRIEGRLALVTSDALHFRVAAASPHRARPGSRVLISRQTPMKIEERRISPTHTLIGLGFTGGVVYALAMTIKSQWR